MLSDLLRPFSWKGQLKLQNYGPFRGDQIVQSEISFVGFILALSVVSKCLFFFLSHGSDREAEDSSGKNIKWRIF